MAHIRHLSFHSEGLFPQGWSWVLLVHMFVASGQMLLVPYEAAMWVCQCRQLISFSLQVEVGVVVRRSCL